jgi:hypothetical protein
MPSKGILFNPNPTLSVEVFTFDSTLCYFPIPPQFCNHFSTFYALGLLKTKENTLLQLPAFTLQIAQQIP